MAYIAKKGFKYNQQSYKQGDLIPPSVIPSSKASKLISAGQIALDITKLAVLKVAKRFYENNKQYAVGKLVSVKEFKNIQKLIDAKFLAPEFKYKAEDKPDQQIKKGHEVYKMVLALNDGFEMGFQDFVNTTTSMGCKFKGINSNIKFEEYEPILDTFRELFTNKPEAKNITELFAVEIKKDEIQDENPSGEQASDEQSQEGNQETSTDSESPQD